MAAIFDTFVYQPLYNILIFLYNNVAFEDFGIAIILFTILVRIILIPLYNKQVRSQQQMQKLQPKIKALQEKYKNDKETQTRKMMELYKEEGTNPFGGCLPLIIQMIFIFAIFKIISNISAANLQVDANELYTFVSNPGTINQSFIGLFDMTKASILIAALAAIAQYFQMKQLMDKTAALAEKNNAPKPKDDTNPDFAAIMNKQMLYLGPILTLVFGMQFPAGLSLYWLAGTIFMLAQQVIVEKKLEAQK